jgi:hypothetical protein
MAMHFFSISTKELMQQLHQPGSPEQRYLYMLRVVDAQFLLFYQELRFMLTVQ